MTSTVSSRRLSFRVRERSHNIRNSFDLVPGSALGAPITQIWAITIGSLTRTYRHLGVRYRTENTPSRL